MKALIISTLKTFIILFGVFLIYCGINSLVIHASAIIEANNRLEFVNIFIALFFAVPGYLILVWMSRITPKWFYKLGGCLIFIGLIYIINYFGFMDHAKENMEGAKLRVFVLMLKINLGVGILTLLGAFYSIQHQMLLDKKEKLENEIAEEISTSG
jgi:hypothetical protein